MVTVVYKNQIKQVSTKNVRRVISELLLDGYVVQQDRDGYHLFNPINNDEARIIFNNITVLDINE